MKTPNPALRWLAGREKCNYVFGIVVFEDEMPRGYRHEQWSSVITSLRSIA
jgi:hypothetical protein